MHRYTVKHQLVTIPILSMREIRTIVSALAVFLATTVLSFPGPISLSPFLSLASQRLSLAPSFSSLLALAGDTAIAPKRRERTPIPHNSLTNTSAQWPFFTATPL